MSSPGVRVPRLVDMRFAARPGRRNVAVARRDVVLEALWNHDVGIGAHDSRGPGCAAT